MTLLVNREGVPLFGSIASGNQSDKTLNTAMIDQLAQALAPDALQQLIYVADSALVTGPNLSRLADAHLAFISRCPETWQRELVYYGYAGPRLNGGHAMH